ncbi:MAG TPA: hypothetical protein VFZ58_01120 [Candidatus Saccharimonadales bacterium]
MPEIAVTFVGDTQCNEYHRPLVEAGIVHVEELHPNSTYKMLAGFERVTRTSKLGGVTGMASRMVRFRENWRADTFRGHGVAPWSGSSNLYGQLDIIMLIGGTPSLRHNLSQYKGATGTIFEVTRQAGGIVIVSGVLPDHPPL